VDGTRGMPRRNMRLKSWKVNKETLDELVFDADKDVPKIELK